MFNSLPFILTLIRNANEFEANQMKCFTEHKMLNSLTPVNRMSDEQKYKFQLQLMDFFIEKKWLK